MKQISKQDVQRIRAHVDAIRETLAKYDYVPFDEVDRVLQGCDAVNDVVGK